MIKKEGKERDTMIRVSAEVRSKLKMKALQKGITLKEYLKQIADEKNK